MMSGTDRTRRLSRIRKAFTLVELLMVIGIIALLISVLLPALNKARESANTVKCAANLRAVGQGIADHLARNRGVYPAAYRYNTANGEPATTLAGEPLSETNGYTHWSYYIYGEGRAPEAAFICPSLTNEGGLPPTYPKKGDEISGQFVNTSIQDKQVRRIAYVPNEAIMPRNKFVEGSIDSGGATTNTPSQLVKASQVKSSASVILMTEYSDNWLLHTSADGLSGESDGKVRSHRPVHAYRGRLPETLNLNEVKVQGQPGGNADFERVEVSSLVENVRPGTPANSRLDLVGRNHGRGKTAKTNFLYCDGHVETKLLKETLDGKWEWGDKIYSLTGNPSIFDRTATR